VVNGEPPMQMCRLEVFLMRKWTLRKKERNLSFGLRVLQLDTILILTTTTITMIEVGGSATGLVEGSVTGLAEGSVLPAVRELVVADHITGEIAEGGDPPPRRPRRQVLALRAPPPRIQIALQNSRPSTKISLA
jgi:hypothetical protein